MQHRPVVGEPMRIALISPVHVHVQGLAQLFRLEHDMELAWSAAGVDAAEQLLGRPDFDVILLDMTGGPVDERGLAALNRLSERCEQPLVVLGIPDQPGNVVACAEAGIAGYVSNDDTFADLLETLRAAKRGEFQCAPGIVAGLVSRLTTLSREYRQSPVGNLTRREMEIIKLVEAGLSNKEIARRLHIQLTTVKNHVHNVLEKLGVESRLDAATAVRRHQLFGTGR